MGGRAAPTPHGRGRAMHLPSFLGTEQAYVSQNRETMDAETRLGPRLNARNEPGIREHYGVVGSCT